MRQFALVLILFLPLTLMAQVSVGGRVYDKADGHPLAKASVSLIRGGKTVKFTRTDDRGHFSLSLNAIEKGDSLQATLMGYARLRQAAQTGNGNAVAMETRAFQMREVVVKAERITGRDTITYDLTRFADERDNTLKDVLRKLPGVDVAKNGEIKYKGKAINRFTVEGLDLSNGRYNLLTDNIHAKDVKKAEVVEHDQPIKALQNKVTTDDVAMNVELKDSVRDRFSFTLCPYVLVGKPTNAGGSAKIMQIGKKRQLLYDIAYDRTGRDLGQSSHKFYSSINSLGMPKLPVWYSAPSLSAPIDKSRLRFNTSQHYTVNHITKGRNDSENRINAGYTRTVERQHIENTTLYYMEGGTPTMLTEDRRNEMVKDQFSLDFSHKINTSSNYGTIDLSLNAAQKDALSNIESTAHSGTQQRVRLPEINASAEWYRLYTLRKGTLSWKSIVDYHFSKNKLSLESADSKSQSSKSELNNRLWHTAHELSWSWARNFIRRTYAFGVDAKNLNVEYNNFVGSVYIEPSWMYERGQWRVGYSQKWTLSRYANQQQTLWLTSPALYANYKASNRTEWRGVFSGGTSADGWNTFALSSYQSNYRTHYTAADFIPKTRYISGRLSYSYKRPIREVFLSATLNASRNWRNAVTDMHIEDGDYYYSYQKRETRNEQISTNLSFSKGFHKLHLKTSLDASVSYSGGEQYVSGTLLRYNYRALSLEPKVLFSPSWLIIDYNGSFSLGRSHTSGTSLGTLFDHTQRLSLTTTIRKVDLGFSAVYYHNELDGSSSINTLLADATLAWRLKKVRFSIEVRNLFDKTSYAETTYSGIGSFTNRYYLRPRELKMSAQFNL